MLANIAVHVILVKCDGMSFMQTVGYPHTLQLNTMLGSGNSAVVNIIFTDSKSILRLRPKSMARPEMKKIKRDFKSKTLPRQTPPVFIEIQT